MFDTRKNDFKKLEGRLRPLSFDYTRKFLKIHCQDINMLEYGLIHRNGSIHYHFDLVREKLSEIKEEALNDSHNFLRKNLGFDFKLGYIFDDLIFNLMSFYDYLASYIGYMLYDTEIREGADGYDPLDPSEHKYDHLEQVLYKLSWTSIAKLSANPPEMNKIIGVNENKLSGTSLSKIIDEYDCTFIEPLSRYRNRVIHNAVESPAIDFELVFGAKNNIEFKTPINFLDKFETYPLSFIKTLEKLIDTYLRSIESIINGLSAYIEKNRRIPKGQEIYMYEHEIKEYRKLGLID